jgi:hypothetical protein
MPPMQRQSLRVFFGRSAMAARLDAAHSVLLRTGVPAGWMDMTVTELARIVGGGTPDRQSRTTRRSSG